MANKIVTNLPQYGTFTTDAAMQAFFTEYTTFFENNGFERTSDTGQFNPATAAGTGTFYEIRKFTGTHASTAPVFVKISWIARCQSYSVTVGLGSDGAGNLTNEWGSSSVRNETFFAGTSGVLHLACVAGDFVSFATNAGSGGRGRYFTIGRSLNATTGDVTDKSVSITTGNLGNYTYYQTSLWAYEFATATATGSGQAPIGGNAVSTLGNYCFTIGASPKPLEVILVRRVWVPLTTYVPLPSVVVAIATEVPFGTVLTLTNVGPNNLKYIAACPGTAGSYPLIRWD